MTDIDFIRIAIDFSKENVDSKGAIVVRNGAIIGKGVNQMLSTLDPTAHSEIMALRMACQKEQTLDLNGCVIYCSSEPCPMCMAAIHLVRISRVVYSVSAETVAEYGLSDKSISEQLSLPKKDRKLKMEQIFLPESVDALTKWTEKNL